VKETINNLNSQLELQAEKNESEFLAAYQGHMVKVQQELIRLKKKSNECEFIIKKDDKVKKL
jgi:hypothetical protein